MNPEPIESPSSPPASVDAKGGASADATGASRVVENAVGDYLRAVLALPTPEGVQFIHVALREATAEGGESLRPCIAMKAGVPETIEAIGALIETVFDDLLRADNETQEQAYRAIGNRVGEWLGMAFLVTKIIAAANRRSETKPDPEEGS